MAQAYSKTEFRKNSNEAKDYGIYFFLEEVRAHFFSGSREKGFFEPMKFGNGDEFFENKANSC